MLLLYLTFGDCVKQFFDYLKLLNIIFYYVDNFYMKKALKLALIYLIILVTGTVFGTVLYSFYLNLLGFIAGQEITFFTDTELVKSFFYVLLCMYFFVIPVTAYYRIRHPGGFLQLIVFTVLCLLTWGLLFPLTVKLRDFCYNRFTFIEEESTLSPNYFRHVDKNVYYFTSDFEDKSKFSFGVKEAPVVIISTEEDGKVEYTNIKNYDNFELIRKSLPFREIQLKKIFDAEKNPIPVDFKVLIENTSKSYFGGFNLKRILTLLSFILVLSSVYGITAFFDWRLLNTTILFVVSASILSFNSIYFQPAYIDLKIRLTSNGFFTFLGKIASEPLLFLVNCIFALLFISLGVIKFAVRKHAAKVN